jgi:Bacterial regulatory helix-turn-helix protein, lysR family
MNAVSEAIPERRAMKPTSHNDDPTVRRLLTGLLGASMSERERKFIWSSLGMGSTQYGVVLVFRERFPSPGFAQRIKDSDPGCVSVAVGSDIIVVAQQETTLRSFAEMATGVRVGIGYSVAVSAIHLSYAHALEALDFTDYGGPVSRVISHRELGALAVLARVPRKDLLALPDLPIISAIHQEATGRAELEALEAFCRTGTLRRAAKLLHMHHSSIAKRINNVEKALGHRLTEPIPLSTAYAGVLALRLLGSAGVPNPRRSFNPMSGGGHVSPGLPPSFLHLEPPGEGSVPH